MKKMIAILGLATLMGCDGTSLATGTDGSVLADGTVDTDAGATDIDGGVDSAVPDTDSGTVGTDAGVDGAVGADAGGSDSGTTADGSVDAGPQPSCSLTNLDTGTYTFPVHGLSAKYPNFNIDGVDNSNPVAGCGITDTVEGFDNGFGTLTANEFGGAPHGMAVPYFENMATAALFDNGGDLELRVVLTNVRVDVVANPNDPCVGVRIDVIRPSVTYASAYAEAALVNGRVQGAFPAPLGLHFNVNGVVLDFEIEEPVFDITMAANWAGFQAPKSFIGGHMFFAPTAEDTAAGRDYTAYEGIDAMFTRTWGAGYTQFMHPYFGKYADVHMEPDGTLTPCSSTVTPNSYAVAFRFAR